MYLRRNTKILLVRGAVVCCNFPLPVRPKNEGKSNGRKEIIITTTKFFRTEIFHCYPAVTSWTDLHSRDLLRIVTGNLELNCWSLSKIWHQIQTEKWDEVRTPSRAGWPTPTGENLTNKQTGENPGDESAHWSSSHWRYRRVQRPLMVKNGTH